MPRQDVPYGGAICRLKERIAEIWDELGKKLHSINGIEGDGQGDVKIVSRDPAVVITDDHLQHEIEISLDTSQLPAAAVSSVNGQTGAVALDAGDIPSDGNSDVQTDIDVNKAAISACSSAITSEQLARQNADSTLQGNINTLSASIPTAAATAVANDPTVAQLATDVPNKVDKITSGSSLKAYTHTGATQGETSVVDGTTANSIGIRDANGRMQAADPASGATDKTLVTANWVSQTGSGTPNNLMHTNGDETANGTKTLPDGVYGRNSGDKIGSFGGSLANDSTTILNAFSVNVPYNCAVIFTIYGCANNKNVIYAKYMLVRGRSNTTPALFNLIKKISSAAQEPYLYFTYNATQITIYARKCAYIAQYCCVDEYLYYGNVVNPSSSDKMILDPAAGTTTTLPAGAIVEVNAI